MSKSLDYLEQRQNLACICGSNRGVTICRKDRYGLRFLYKFCTSCGHVRTCDPLAQESAVRFYSSSDYRSMYFPNESPLDVLKRKAPPHRARTPLLKYVESLGVEHGVIVEWGCGGGWNLVPFRDAGWETLGFDYDATYISLGREVLGLELTTIGDAGSTPVITKPPDVILLNHVLEHALDPVSLLRLLRDLSDGHTMIVVGVPLLETIRTWHWKNFYHIAHIHYFSARSLKFVAQQAGLELVNEQPKVGLFTFRPTQSVLPLMNRHSRRAALHSAFLLLVGYIDFEFRTRAVVRRVLAMTGLLNRARQFRTQMKS